MKRDRFYKNRHGSAVIEFAIVAPVLFLMLLGIIEMGLVFFTTNIMEAATNIAARIGKTGYSGNFPSRDQYIRDQIYRLSGGFLDSRRIEISILSYGEFANIGQEEPFTDQNGNNQYDFGEPFIDINGNGRWDRDQGAGNPGGRGDVVFYRVSYPWSIFTPLIGSLVTDESGNYEITALATIRNERF